MLSGYMDPWGKHRNPQPSNNVEPKAPLPMDPNTAASRTGGSEEKSGTDFSMEDKPSHIRRLRLRFRL